MQEGPALLNHGQAKSRAFSSSAEVLIAVKNTDSRVMLCRDVPPSNPATELGNVCQEFISMPHFNLFFLYIFECSQIFPSLPVGFS